MMWLDLVVAADPRLRGADGRCLAALLESAAVAGYRTGLLPLRGSSRATAQRVAPALRPLLGRRQRRWLDTGRPVQAGLVLVYHVGAHACRGRPRRAQSRRTTACLLRLDQPALAAPARPVRSRRI